MGVRNLSRSLLNGPDTKEEQTLLELACLSHDIGKANMDWQSYIKGNKMKGPTHSSAGAIFFSYLAYHWLDIHNQWDLYQWRWLTMFRDISDHHSYLKSISASDLFEPAPFHKMDMQGIEDWIFQLYPVFRDKGIYINEKTLDTWQTFHLSELIEEVHDQHIEDSLDRESTYKHMMETLQHMRQMTSILIASDRFDIKQVPDVRFQPPFETLKQHIQKYCEKGNHHPLANVRVEAQNKILSKWKEYQEEKFFTLEMPTGYGKTITSLKVAVECFINQNMSKILYVAPYLSILEQNAKEIGSALQVSTLDHHSMAILNNKLLEEEDDELLSLVTQSWANGVVCTSFVQFMKAIFPKRAQDTLRRIYLKNSVILIDEPQIMDAQVWNLFLMGLEGIAEQLNCKVVFISATMPPFTYGLSQKPVTLSVSSSINHSRYTLQQRSPMNEEQCAKQLQERAVPSAVAIVNTIKDAIHVYNHLQKSEDEIHYLIHGLMIPLHKNVQIRRIQESLEKVRDKKLKKNVKVVSTQIIEAGANLSFHYMYRARAILPSIMQAAGRLNRHKELRDGLIETGAFIRNENGKESRQFVYPAGLCRITDELLSRKEIWKEHELEELVKEYYIQMFQENSYEAILQDIEKAADGNWEDLTRHAVFQEETRRLPVFIPWDWQPYQRYIPEQLLSLIQDFHIRSPESIYELFLSPERRSWSVQKQKAFSKLFHLFVLQIPVNRALQLISQDDFIQYKIPKLEDSQAYHRENGLMSGVNEIDDFII